MIFFLNFFYDDFDELDVLQECYNSINLFFLKTFIIICPNNLRNIFWISLKTEETKKKIELNL